MEVNEENKLFEYIDVEKIKRELKEKYPVGSDYVTIVNGDGLSVEVEYESIFPFIPLRLIFGNTSNTNIQNKLLSKKRNNTFSLEEIHESIRYHEKLGKFINEKLIDAGVITEEDGVEVIEKKYDEFINEKMKEFELNKRKEEKITNSLQTSNNIVNNSNNNNINNNSSNNINKKSNINKNTISNEEKLFDSSNNSSNKKGNNNNNTNSNVISLEQKLFDSMKKNYDYEFSNNNLIFEKVLSYDFYENPQITCEIPDIFYNENCYRNIFLYNFFNELKFNLLNNKNDSIKYEDNFKVELFWKEGDEDLKEILIKNYSNLTEDYRKMIRDNDLVAILKDDEVNIDFNKLKLNKLDPSVKAQFILAIVRKNKDINSANLLIKKNELSKLKNEKKKYTIIYINSINSAYREFTALFDLNLGKINRDILFKKKKEKENENEINIKNEIEFEGAKKERDEYINKIKNKGILNSSQFNALKSVNDLQSGNVLLIQGPPGTGKTKTILGIISLIYSKTQSRILICTPSNNAIDEICYRLSTEGIYGDKVDKIYPDYIRFGNTGKIFSNMNKENDENIKNRNEIIYKHTLDYLIREQIINNRLKNDKKFINLQNQKETALKYKNNLNENKIYERTPEYIDLSNSHNSGLKDIDNEMEKMILQAMKKEKNKYQEELLRNTKILCTTLNSSGNDILKDNDFDCLIIDEACQSVEPSCIIPLSHNVKYMILVGDHKQLRPTVFSKESQKNKYERSLFERLIDNGMQPLILNTQYRMENNISKVISKIFYEDELKDDQTTNKKIQENQIYKVISLKKNFYFFDNKQDEESKLKNNGSYYNEMDIEFIVRLLSKLLVSLKSIEEEYQYNYKYAIITPYKTQVEKLKENEYIQNFLITNDIKIETVDSFQGQERDIVIFSSVRSNIYSEIGFLNDIRRLNVALSRAKYACFIIGNRITLSSSEIWRNLIQCCLDNDCYYLISNTNNEEYDKAIDNIFLTK